jgi:hypothetical protein
MGQGSLAIQLSFDRWPAVTLADRLPAIQSLPNHLDLLRTIWLPPNSQAGCQRLRNP